MSKIDVRVMMVGGRFQGFIPDAAIHKGAPTKERVAEINENYIPASDGWIYHIDKGQMRKHHFCGIRK